MGRQSITLTEPNDQWLKEQVESREYASKSEILNDLIRQARNQQKELDWIRTKLEKAEQREFSDRSPEEILFMAKKLE